jgi:hypothetical protein
LRIIGDELSGNTCFGYNGYKHQTFFISKLLTLCTLNSGGTRIYCIIIMTREKFNTLTLEERCTILWYEGKYLDSLKYYGYKSTLYAVGSFFAEVLCQQGSAEIETINIADDEILTKYLNRIDIHSLYDVA